MNIKSFFLENIGIKQTIFKNTLWLAIAEIIVQALKLVLIVYMARLLGAEEYGKFSFALSFVGLFVIFAELGLPDVITREFAKNKEGEKQYSAIISLKIFLSMATLLIMISGSFFITKDIIIRKAIWFLSFFILITSFINIFYAFFRARQKMEYESIFKVLQYVLLTSLSFLALLIFPSIENVSQAYLVSNVIILALVLGFFHFFVQPVRIVYQRLVWKKFVYFSWPLALGLMIGWIYVSVSSVLLGYFGYNMENGWYNAAYKIIGAVTISAILISRSFFPVLSKFSAESKERLQKVWNYQKEVMMILAFPMVAGAIVLAPKIIYFFYDGSYGPSITAFRWLAVVCGIDFLYYPYALALIIFNEEKRNFAYILLGLALNILLNIILIPKYGLNGVVVANIISSWVVLLLAIRAVIKCTPILPFNAVVLKTFMLVLTSSAIMLAIIATPVIYSFHLGVVVILGMASYMFFYLTLQVIISRLMLKPTS